MHPDRPVAGRLSFLNVVSTVVGEWSKWSSETSPVSATPLLCKACEKETRFRALPQLPSRAGIIMDASSHAEMEKWARYCPGCNCVICGQCSFPEWQARKAKEGLTGPQLAAKLENTPGALFFERPTCPLCRGYTTSAYGPKPLRDRIRKRLDELRASKERHRIED